MATEPTVDAYIAAQAAFAQPILTHLRGLIRAASPEIGEAIKWGMPFFTYKGQNLCNMAGFKGHVAFGFWHDKVAGKDASRDAIPRPSRDSACSEWASWCSRR